MILNQTLPDRWADPKDTFARGHRPKEAITVAEIQKATVTIESPTGPLTLTYGSVSNGYARDAWETRFRSTDIARRSIDAVRAEVARIEAEHQAAKAIKKIRDEAAKNPLPAVLLPAAGPRDVPTENPRRVHVRGIDQRNGYALVVDVDGAWFSAPPTRVLRDLDDDDVNTIIRLLRDARAAHKTAKMMPSNYLSHVFAAHAVRIDLTIHVDVNTSERVTSVGDQEFRGTDRTDVECKVYAAVAKELGYRCDQHGDPLGDALPSYAQVFKTPEDAYEWRATEAAAGMARGHYEAHIQDADLLFDLSLFSGLTATAPEAPTTDEEVITVHTKAPDVVPEWDD